MSKTKAQRIAKHIENVQRIFPGTKDADPTTLAADLRGLERAAHFAALRFCNDAGYYNSGQHEKNVKHITRELRELLKWKPGDPRVFIDSDPRGYALKIDDGDLRQLFEKKGYDIERDWGGYGILWPNFDN